MAHKKVKFQTLQRFDLKDAEVLQSGVDDKLGTSLKALNVYNTSSLRHGGPIDKVTVRSVASGVVTFGPIKVLNADANDVIELTQDDVDNGLTQLDISALYQSYISQRNGGIGTTAIHFYAYPLVEDTDVEQREFFSVINNVQETRNVVTRSRTRLTFFALINNSSYYIADENGNQPIYLGKVLDANISSTNSQSPFTPNSFISSNYFKEIYAEGEDWDDTGFPNAGERVDFSGFDNLSDGNTYTGLMLAFKRLERQLNRIVSYGEFDDRDTTVLPLNSKPQYSLQGLNRKVLDLYAQSVITSDSIRNENATSTIFVTYNRSSGISQTNFIQDTASNDFTLTGHLNWALALANGTASVGDDFGDLDEIPGAMGDLCTSPVIELPSHLLGKRIVNINVELINPGIEDNALSANGDLDAFGLNWCRIITNNAQNIVSEGLLVRNETWSDNNGDETTAPAILLKLGPELLYQQNNTRFMVKVTITIDVRS